MASPEAYNTEEFNSVLALLIQVFTLPPNIAPSAAPKAVLLGGQSGAGKTALHDIFKKRFEDNVIVINGDEFRSHHPRFHQLQRLYGDKAVDYTAPWAGRMTEALIESLSAIGYNLIIEGTLRTSDVPLRTAQLLRDRRYDVSLALMAVKPEISLVSCQLRYEEMRLAGTTPRATDPEHHQKIIRQIVENLSTLENSGMFNETLLYTRSHTCIYPRDGFSGTASEALEEKLFGAWSPEEEDHLLFLQKRFEGLRAQECDQK